MPPRARKRLLGPILREVLDRRWASTCAPCARVGSKVVHRRDPPLKLPPLLQRLSRAKMSACAPDRALAAWSGKSCRP